MARGRSARGRRNGGLKGGAWSLLGVGFCLGLTVPASSWGQAVPTFPQLPTASQLAQQPAGQPPAAVKSAAPAAGQVTPAPAPAAPGTPARSGPRDPFDPLVKPLPTTERAAQQLAGLKLVGVVWDAKNREQVRALIETPDGLGYYVRVNEEKFGAKVVGIERDRVKFAVREQVPGGQPRERTVELKLGSQ